MPPQMFSISSNFVLWETASQTKNSVARLKSNILPPPTKFWVGFATQWSYNRKTSSHFQVCWRVLFSETWHRKILPFLKVTGTTKQICILNGFQKSVKFTQVKALCRFFMHQWLDVFTSDLHIFEYVHLSVNFPPLRSASVRLCGVSSFRFNFPHYLVPHTPSVG